MIVVISPRKPARSEWEFGTDAVTVGGAIPAANETGAESRRIITGCSVLQASPASVRVAVDIGTADRKASTARSGHLVTRNRGRCRGTCTLGGLSFLAL